MAELQAQQLEEFNRQAEVKRRRLKKNRAAGEATSGTRNNDDELFGTTTRTLRGQNEIEVEARRQRKKSLKQTKATTHEELGLGGTDVARHDYAVSPKLEEAIERSRELSEEIIILDGEDKKVQGSNQLIQEKVVSDQGA